MPTAIARPDVEFQTCPPVPPVPTEAGCLATSPHQWYPRLWIPLCTARQCYRPHGDNANRSGTAFSQPRFITGRIELEFVQLKPAREW